MKRLWMNFSMTSLLITLIGCATQSSPSSVASAMRRAEEDSAASPEYKLGVGDLISVKFFYNAEFNEEVIITPDGKISLQLIDDIQAAGLTSMELDRVITEKYAETLADPEVTVIVRRLSAKVYVGGEVHEPKFVDYSGGLTILQAIFSAGGFAETAEPSSVILIRENGKPSGTRVKIDLNRALQGQGEDILLSPSDIVYVPRSTIASVNRFVDQYIRKNMGFSMPFPIPGLR